MTLLRSAFEAAYEVGMKPDVFRLLQRLAAKVGLLAALVPIPSPAIIPHPSCPKAQMSGILSACLKTMPVVEGVSVESIAAAACFRIQ